MQVTALQGLLRLQLSTHSANPLEEKAHRAWKRSICTLCQWCWNVWGYNSNNSQM